MLCPPPAPIVWQIPPTSPTLAPSAVHVWFGDLDLAPATDRLFPFLTPTEQDRADRYHGEQLRHRFAAARVLLRWILASYLGIRPQGVELVYGDRGKPSLGPSHNDQMPLHFNLSHSHNLALCGVARSAIGVDLEQLRPLDNALNLAQRFFAPAESARLEQLTPGELASGFFRHWVCKEAYVKAIGQGLAHQLDQVQISFQSQAQLILPAASDIEQPSEQPNTEQLNNLAKTWTLRELTPQAQTVAAVVTQTLPTSWHFWQGHWNFVE